MPSQAQIPKLSANVGEGLRLQGLLLCALFAAAEPKIREGAQKKRKTPVASDSELWVIYPNPYTFGTFSGQPNNFNKQNFIDIIANNGRCFPAGNNGLVPLIIVIINRKSSGWKRTHAQKCSPGFGLSLFVVGDCFSLSPVFPPAPHPRFISHLLSCSVSVILF